MLEVKQVDKAPEVMESKRNKGQRGSPPTPPSTGKQGRPAGLTIVVEENPGRDGITEAKERVYKGSTGQQCKSLRETCGLASQSHPSTQGAHLRRLSWREVS